MSIETRPGALPIPADRQRVQAFTKIDVMQRWTEEMSSVRPAALAQGDNVITMFDFIGEDFWTGGGVTAKGVSRQLRAIGDRPVEVHINSFGGDMFEGIAIYNVLREHPQDVTVKVMGLAASAASIIAMAGDRIEIGAASFLMIHNCWVMAVGNRHDMQAAADQLGEFDKALASVYAARTGLSADGEIAAMMDRDYYISGASAVDQGFADALLLGEELSESEVEKAKAKAMEPVRAMEMTLIAAGRTRAEARAEIMKIKGTPGAALAGTPDAAELDWGAAMAGLRQALIS